ncbi:MAG: glycosyltransferase family 2 protein [Candidatus Eremiobacteraeota bacterium]|nr:glycosyltransferase family 2 protein [Candidatus Eremiobacteraeota bacterium]MBV8284828.1 glycosyltransferase family 2 protein [Candidatus Eremiobacteraeota bacterium]MBV8332984.1 glycosyltransferase family 2 protein [Candidatus Eremiobacteraeota bacterium]MBV8433703.1 glycosyltransferase family 2 protein [Candidatus Eremiobacteraeota bacterium]MBV8722040.1 glycosyltransferase family 2 protein [Candidatus Eremiobacteraeota bacterium]
MVRARIVVVSYNAAEFIGGALESALAQTVPCEVVVVDNDSSDATAELVAARYPAIRVIRSGANLGFGAAANLGAFDGSPAYEYLALLNSDARAQPSWIERTCAWMERAGVGIGSSVVSAGSGTFFAGGAWRPLLGAAIKRARYTEEATDWVSGCAMIARRSAFERLGGFDDAYFLYFEDVDLSLRASATGVRLGVFGEALVDHPQEGRSADQLGSLLKRRIGLYSKGRCVRRFVPGYALPAALAFQCSVSPFANGASPREYPSLVAAFLAGFRGSRSGSPSPRSTN